MSEIASRLGIALIGPPLNSPIDDPEYRRVLAVMMQQDVDMLFVATYGENRQLIAELAAARGLPAMHPYRGFVDAGGLMEYAADSAELHRHAAQMMDRIFKGEKAGNIPFYQPTKFELRINLNAARALALELPASLLACAG
jgi:putative ABC transport system substrate-binding protein